MADAPALAVVVLNHRTPDLTVQCLRSLAPEASALPEVTVVVADNGSGDGSVETFRRVVEEEGWGTWARVVALERNGGFAWGNNRGAEAAGTARHVLLLNSDTVVREGCLAHCLRVLDGDPTIGAMSCRVLNADGSVQCVARRFPDPVRHTLGALGLPWKLPGLFGWAQTDYSDWAGWTGPRDADWLGGAFLCVRGDLWRRLGGFDEGFFFYGEDIELCHRIRRAGFRCRWDPGAEATHLGGASSDPTRMDAASRSLHFWRGRYLVQRRCWGRAAEAWARAVDLATCGVRVVWMRVFRGASDGRYRELRDTVRILAHPLGGAQ